MIPTGILPFFITDLFQFMIKFGFFLLCIVVSNASSPSVLEEKCSKNEHDAVPVGLCGKGPHNTQAGELASSDDVLLVNGKSDASEVPEDDEHSEDISVVATQCSLYISG